jgi:hypothetical protein
MRYKYLIPVMILMLLISQSAIFGASDESSGDDLADRIMDEINSIKNKLIHNETSSSKSIEVTVHGYDELKECIEEYNNKDNNESYLIKLEDGDYNITGPILYRGKDSNSQELIIDGNGHVIDGQHKNRFMHYDNANITVRNLIVQNTVQYDKDHAGVFEMIARAIAGFALVPIIGFTGTCLGNPIAWIMADAFLIPAYFHVSKVLHQRKATGV